MEAKKIQWKQAIELLNSNKTINQDEIEFNEIIHIHDVIIFNKNGINVPEHLINYDDENIDCSDIQEITLDDIKTGKLIKVLPAQIKLDTETENWIKKSNINYNELLSNLLKNFYQSIKTLPNKAAF
jgi:hypothetical protein